MQECMQCILSLSYTLNMQSYLLHVLFHLRQITLNVLHFFPSYKNGSLTRERIRDICAGGSWEKFEHLLTAAPPGNDGNIGMYSKSKNKTSCGHA